MRCVKCNGENVVVQMKNVGGKTKKHGNGIGGHTNNILRWCLAICTLGISNLFWKKSKGSEKMTFKQQKICLCQTCGHSWNLPT